MQLRDKSSQTWRQVKIAAIWGAQILLYPLYVGFQGTRLAGKQLRQTVRQVFPRLRSAASASPPAPEDVYLTADAPIQRSLQTLKQLNLTLPASRIAVELDPEAPQAQGTLVVLGGSALKSMSQDDSIGLEIIEADSSTLARSGGHALSPSRLQVQGIASRLDSQHLVLVTSTNQILDVLSLEQQMVLQKRIVAELAGYWRQQRTLGIRETPWVSTFLPLPKERTHALLPIRAFWQLMTWMQTSAVAAATNLFQEAQLESHLTPALNGRQTPLRTLRSAQPTWQSRAEWAAGMQTWWHNGVQKLSALPAQIAGYLVEEPGSKDQPILPASTAKTPWLTMDDLFHGTRLLQRHSPLARSSNTAAMISSAADSTNWELQDPSRLNDLTQNELSQREVTRRANARQSLRSLLSFRRSQQSTLPGATQQEFPSSRSSSDRIKKHQIYSVAAIPSHVPPSLQPASEANGTLATPPATPAEELVSHPSWIEAEVRLVTYEKHPLEQLLGWLDRSMSWIEDRVVKVWHWLRGHWPH